MSQPSIKSWQTQLHSGLAAVSISQNGEKIAAGALGKAILCLNNTGQPLWQQEVGNQAWRTGISQDGQTIIVGTGSTRPWDMKGRGLYCFNGDGSQRWKKDLSASIWGLALSADGSTIAAGTSAKELLLLDSQGNLLFKEKVRGIGWYAWVWDASLSADGEIVAAGAADKHLRIFQKNGTTLARHKTQADVFATAVSADGRIIAAGDSSGRVYCLDNNGNLLWQEQISEKVWAVALSADGQKLLVGADEKEAHIRVYNQQGRPTGKRYVGHAVTNVGMSADSRRIIAGTRDGGIFIFNDDNVLHKAQAGKIVRDVAISADGRWAVAGSEDGFIYGFQLPSRPEKTSETPVNDFANQLFQVIKDRFNFEETRTLCFQMGVEYDDLPGDGRSAKARELVSLMKRTNQLDQLWKTIQAIRPDITNL